MCVAILKIDLGALRHNYDLIKSEVRNGCAVAGVVKANAYGLGLKEVVSVLELAGCPFYFVALPEEAFALRSLTQKPIAVLSGCLSGYEEEFIAHDIIPVLNHLGAVAAWKDLARQKSKKLPAAVQFETGMNRLGLPEEEIQKFLNDPSLREGLDLCVIMSHFSCADEADHPLTAEQYKKFSAIAAHFPTVPKSLANSSGIFRGASYHFDMVRPGMALYGLNPVPEEDNPMRPVVSLYAPVLQVKTVKAGEAVGYGASFRAKNDVTIATVALGYADGFLRSIGNSGKGVLYFQGKPCPLVGRVSMDLVTADVTGLSVKPEDFLEVLGPYQDADTLAGAAGSIGYEILTSLGPRYKKEYVNGLWVDGL